MKDLILKLKTLLPAKDFIVTGSYVLSLFGLADVTNDLDIILISPEQSAVDTINRLMKEFPAKTTIKQPIPDIPKEKEEEGELYGKPLLKATAKKKPTPECSAIFMYDNIKVDVFVEAVYTRQFLLIDGVKYSTIKNIIDAKKGYGRMKDWLQLRDMARLFFKEEDFQAMLNTSWRNTLKSEY
jgi:hypothetical protein